MHVRFAAQSAIALSVALGASSLRLHDPDDIEHDGLWRSVDRDGAEMIDPAYAEQDRLEVDALFRDSSGFSSSSRPPIWSVLMNESADGRLPRTMWSFWEDGQVPPPLNNVSLRQWQHLNPGWQQTIHNRSSVRKLFPDLARLFDRIPRTVQLRSDMLRLWILAERGGVWVDASVLPLEPLDNFVGKVVRRAGFWTFFFPPSRNGHVTTWFMAALPRNPLVLRWKEAFMKKWEDANRTLAYFELHHTLTDLVHVRDEVVMKVWWHMPKVGEDWPQACLRGCKDYWNKTKLEDRPPMLKRPFQQGAGIIPKAWWKDYWDFMEKRSRANEGQPGVRL